MPATKKQHKRLDIIDALLGTRKWLLEELLERVNDRLDGQSIDRRTLFRDINYLISEEGAPIHRPEKGDNLYYYTHKFSRKTIPIDEDDVASLKKAIEILKQVENFELLTEVDAVIRKLENRIHTNAPASQGIVQFEKHTTSLGHEYFNDLFDAVQAKSVLRITYQSFQSDKAKESVVHPYLLKEFRNRWFLIGREEGNKRITTYALDRIKKIKNTSEAFIENDLFDPSTYYDHVIGVTVNEGVVPEVIEIKAYKSCAPYILSKPIHRNQEVIKRNKDGSIVVRLRLIINYELKSMLLSYGEGIEVKRPVHLRNQIAEELTKCISFYV